MNLLKTGLIIGATLSQTAQAFPPQQTTPSTKTEETTPSTKPDNYPAWGHKSPAVMWSLGKQIEFSSEKRNAIDTYLSLPIGPERQKAYENVLTLYGMPLKQEFIFPEDTKTYPDLYKGKEKLTKDEQRNKIEL